MIRVDHITITFDGAPVVEDLSFEVAAGEKVALAGPSGSGKSSILRAIIGAVRVQSGTIRVDGVSLSPTTIHTIRSAVAFVGQEPVLGAATVREALLLPFTFQAHRGRSPDPPRLVEVLDHVGLDEALLDRPSEVLSGGERQRVALARAILLGKRIFLTDEITSALDPENKDRVHALLRAPDLTVLSVTHDDAWIALCDRVISL